MPPPTTAHITRDASRDIQKLADHLQGKKAVICNSERTTPPFTDPVTTGWKKLAISWLKDTLSRTLPDEEETSSNGDSEVELADLWDIS